MPNPTEVRFLDQHAGMLENDKLSMGILAAIASRGTLAVKSMSSTSTSVTQDNRTVIFLTPTAACTLTLLNANYWGADRTPMVVLVNKSPTYNITLQPAGANLVNGAATYTLAPSGIALLVTDGVSNWYVK